MGDRRWRGLLGLVATLLAGGSSAWHAADYSQGTLRVDGEVTAVRREGRTREATVRVPTSNPYFGSYNVDCYFWPPDEGEQVTLLLKPMPGGLALAEFAGWRGVWALPLVFCLPGVISVVTLLWPGGRRG